MIYQNLWAIYHNYILYVQMKKCIQNIIYALINPKKNPNIVSKLPIPV